MPDLKLPKLPDRTFIKHTIIVSPTLETKLKRYAELYHETYGAEETVETLVPFILEAFLQSDRGFQKLAKDKPK